MLSWGWVVQPSDLVYIVAGVILRWHLCNKLWYWVLSSDRTASPPFLLTRFTLNYQVLCSTGTLCPNRLRLLKQSGSKLKKLNPLLPPKNVDVGTLQSQNMRAPPKWHLPTHLMPLSLSPLSSHSRWYGEKLTKVTNSSWKSHMLRAPSHSQSPCGGPNSLMKLQNL